eukprot:scaffold80393_cov42-Phaeocystis_antarctica.AAC.1
MHTRSGQKTRDSWKYRIGHASQSKYQVAPHFPRPWVQPIKKMTRAPRLSVERVWLRGGKGGEGDSAEYR